MVHVKEYKRKKNLYSVKKERKKFYIEFQLGEGVQVNHSTLAAVAKYLNKEIKRKCSVPNVLRMPR